MREVYLRAITEVLDPRTGHTLQYPRMADSWVSMMEDYGYVVTHTEQELPTRQQGEQQ